jgi:23S rRNA (cytosine1962-C5)-methyltransferase
MNADYMMTQWDDYELIDSGEGEKLERFGKYILKRPEPQALWRRSMPLQQWNQMCQGAFRREGRIEDMGEWTRSGNMPDRWNVAFDYGNMKLKFRLGLTAFKHVGIFPEQSSNWRFIYDSVCRLKQEKEEVQVLNLFAYTGGASLAACAGGAAVTHVDSVKQVVTWARENMELSGLKDIRWIVEDAMKFVKREVRRGKKYDGLILDPPAYGRGTDGERWVLEKNIDEMLHECVKLLSDKGFLVLNLYSMGLSALLARTALRQIFTQTGDEQMGELYFADRFGKELPLGTFCRFSRMK